MNNETASEAIAVLTSQIEFMREDIRDMRKDLTAATTEKVSHREWSQRNSEVNGKFAAQGREIGELRAEIRSKSAPWWSVGSLIVSIAVLAYTVLSPN